MRQDPGPLASGEAVRNDLSGTVHGPALQAGSIHTLNYTVAPLSDATAGWPLRVGAVPDLATAHQPRTALRDHVVAAQDDCGTVVLSQVLSGGGGVGKTQLAAALAHQALHGGTDLVVWADASRPEHVLGTYARAGAVVRAPGATGQDLETNARAFLDWAATTDRSWLIVLDDLGDPAALRGWWPPTHAGRTTGPSRGGPSRRAVITTRRKGADIGGGGRQVIDVSAYTAAESASYLHDRLTAADAPHLLDGAVEEVGEALGHLPLALGYAAAWMINEDRPCAAYLRHYRDQERRLDDVLPADGDGDGYGREVTAALLLSLDAAQSARPAGLAAPALALAAFLDPAGHPAEFWETDAVTAFLGARRTPPPPAEPGRSRPTEPGRPRVAGRPAGEAGPEAAAPGAPVAAGAARSAMRLLYRYGLLTVHRDDPQRTVRVHALTGRAARESLESGARAAAVRAVADGLLALWPAEDHQDLARAAALAANTDHLLPHTADLLWRPDGHLLIYATGNYHRDYGLPATAVAYWEQQTDRARRFLGDRHTETLLTHANLGTAYRKAGRNAEATLIREQVLADSERLFGEGNPQTLTARANLAVSYANAGRTDEAIALEERVLADRERFLGRQHPQTLIVRANLAVSYADAGRTAEAIALQEDVLADRERSLGQQHPDVLRARINLAASYASAGRSAEAIALEERVLADRERLLGHDHPDTLRARANLADSYQDTGRTAEAIALQEDVLAASERLLGHQHPDTLLGRANLAVTYANAGHTAQAIALQERVLPDSERLLGQQHPDTLTARANLADSYRRAGRTGVAIVLQEQVLADNTRLRGHLHPDTLACQTNLALSYWDAERGKEATALLRQAVEASRQVLGPEHPHTRRRQERLNAWTAPDPSGPSGDGP
ncbi:tetratricopeptide repeat protein [Streptomyces sp. NPDC050504]|uniref:tetratricopeptide repeat protein n=1 Tax=Streptomyces sp. NPDC050504 TaxID=3365618 RepID=UPI0037A24781